MKQKYRSANFRPKTRALIRQADAILDEYQQQGLVVTVRQLYYQFVSRDLIANTTKDYKKLADTISAARLAGLLDWDAIEDRGRVAQRSSEWGSVKELADIAVRAFRLPRWHGQPKYVELWVEKQALAGVLEPLASQHHVTLMVNKGYSSQSAMRESAKRFRRGLEQSEETEPVLLYLGDHDPSGEDMVRDIRDRLRMFGVRDIQVEKMALTMAQVEKLKPPPNPAKVSDPRFEGYREKYGDKSWELDALNPTTLQKIVGDRLKALVNQRILNRVLDEEKRQRAELELAARAIKTTAFDKRFHRCAFTGCTEREHLFQCDVCREYICSEHDIRSADADGHASWEHWRETPPEVDAVGDTMEELGEDEGE